MIFGATPARSQDCLRPSAAEFFEDENQRQGSLLDRSSLLQEQSQFYCSNLSSQP